MRSDLTLDAAQVLHEDVRQLGFNPEQLTSDEQREILELDAWLPRDRALRKHRPIVSP